MKPTTPRRLRSVAVPTPKPIGGLLDSRFEYVRSEKTDIRVTFARIKAEIAAGKKL